MGAVLLGRWLRGERSLLAFHLLFFVCLNGVLLLGTALDQNLIDLFYIDLLYGVFLLSFLCYRFLKYCNLYRPLIEALDHQSKHIGFYVPQQGDAQTQLLGEVVRRVQQEEAQNNESLRRSLAEMEDYATLWVHEMKTPLAILSMNLSQIEDEALRDSFQEEIDRIGHLAEQFLYYSRSNDFSKDYLITEVPLDRLCAELVKKHARSLIAKRLRIGVSLPEKTVLSDKKWLAYILEQALVNAVKYTPEGGSLVFDLSEDAKSAKLTLTDSGIGIGPEDLPRVFERGFTGQTGRQYGQSTGMGLYLASTLAKRLGHSLNLSSEAGRGTTFAIEFHKFSDLRHLTEL